MSEKIVKKICGISDRKSDGSPVWQKVGVFIQKEDGKQILVLNRAINLAGLEYDDSRQGNNVILNLYDFDDNGQQKPQSRQKPKPVFDDLDDIPF